MTRDNKALLFDYLVWLGVSHSSETVSSYHWALKTFVEWLDGLELDITKIKVKHFVEYNAHLQEDRKCAPRTRSHYFTAIRSFWRFLYREKLVKFRDSHIPMPRVDEFHHYTPATYDQVDALCSVCRTYLPKEMQLEVIVRFLQDTAVRVGEMCAIDLFQLDMKTRSAKIKTFKRKGHMRQVYWSERTHELLERWLEVRANILKDLGRNSDALFITFGSKNKGGRIYKGQVQRSFRELRARAGITKKVTPHSMRHGTAKYSMDNNMHIKHLQDYLGHKKIETTVMYLECKNEKVERAVRSKIFATV